MFITSLFCTIASIPFVVITSIDLYKSLLGIDTIDKIAKMFALFSTVSALTIALAGVIESLKQVVVTPL